MAAYHYILEANSTVWRRVCSYSNVRIRDTFMYNGVCFYSFFFFNSSMLRGSSISSPYPPLKIGRWRWEENDIVLVHEWWTVSLAASVSYVCVDLLAFYEYSTRQTMHVEWNSYTCEQQARTLIHSYTHKRENSRIITSFIRPIRISRVYWRESIQTRKSELFLVNSRNTFAIYMHTNHVLIIRINLKWHQLCTLLHIFVHQYNVSVQIRRETEKRKLYTFLELCSFFLSICRFFLFFFFLEIWWRLSQSAFRWRV